MIKKTHFLNKITTHTALIIISLCVSALLMSVYLYRESMKNIAFYEVENKAIIFLSSMESSVHRLVMARETKSLSKILIERSTLLQDHLNFSIIGIILRDPDGNLIERKILKKSNEQSDNDLSVHLQLKNDGEDQDYIPEDFQKVIELQQPLVERKLRILKRVEGQPTVRVLDILYPIKKRQKDEIVAVIKLVVNVERTFDLVREEYKRFDLYVISGFFFIMMILVFCIIWYTRRQIIHPILLINDGANKVASGDFTIQLTTKSNNEISDLMRSFNKMVDGLKHRDQLRQTLEVAKEVQQNLLPQSNPNIANFDISAKSLYCDETGGDYFDFIHYENDDTEKLGIVIGDVSGHGIPAALLMATTRAFLRQRTALPGSLAEVVTDVNIQLSRDVGISGSFMSMFFLILDGQNKALNWVRAGHDPAIVYNPENDTISELKGEGVILGVDKNHQFTENTLENIGEGQIILLGTDGIWEARNPQGEMFGKQALHSILRESAELNSNKILSNITDTVFQFQNGAPTEDDITLIVIKATSTV